MSFNEWIEESQYIEDKSIFIIKNGIEYKIALTSSVKPKYKKHKMSGRKKYFLSGVELLGIAVADQEEIEQIYEEYPTEKLRYESMFLMQKNSFYTIHLTPKQYRHLTNFLDREEIKLNEAFYFRRHGKMMTTNFHFYKEPTVFKQSKLNVKSKKVNPNEFQDIKKEAKVKK